MHHKKHALKSRDIKVYSRRCVTTAVIPKLRFERTLKTGGHSKCTLTQGEGESENALPPFSISTSPIPSHEVPKPNVTQHWITPFTPSFRQWCCFVWGHALGMMLVCGPSSIRGRRFSAPPHNAFYLFSIAKILQERK